MNYFINFGINLFFSNIETGRRIVIIGNEEDPNPHMPTGKQIEVFQKKITCKTISNFF